ncbi:DNA glycosylase/AP lyase ROS1-like [Andrographis paniculata]|uniref:DNA glycosylase/AP lyase ROS1-like n=1 Tax=Andrographis paniculata TaxID=175694 RepID=UPI0021E94B8E|nr:DNA glycosylase/AP lyase ROS1-like [Andrographis paniculata]XP_051131166.1 DNA glycosylase/AP lyase ROS1-like [Andrographis paniculata]
MAVRREEKCPKLEEFQKSSSWVPATPVKQTSDQLICANWQENIASEVDLPKSLGYSPVISQERLCGSGRLPETLPEEVQCQIASACCSSSNLIKAGENSSNWQARADKNINFGGHNLRNISFMKHLQNIEEARSQTAVVENALTSNSPHFTISTVDSCLQLQENWDLVGANLEAGLDRPNVSTDGNFIQTRAFYNINQTPRTVKDAVSSMSIPSQFQPVTPEQYNKAAYWEDLGRQPQGKDLVSAVMNARDNRITTDGEMELPRNKEKSKLIIDLSCATIPPELQENHKPDKGSAEETDLIQTPQQKPRRKKHRPKVVIEGQQKNTPKSSAGKTNAPQESTRVKRKYIRKKGTNNPLEGETDLNKKTPPPTGQSVGKRKYVRKKGINNPEGNLDNGTSETADVKHRRHTRSSCRRSLPFDTDCQARDESSVYCPSASCNMVSQQAENTNATDQSRTEPCEQGLVIMERTGMSNFQECAHSYNNQVWENCKEIPVQSFQYSSKSTNVHPLKETLLSNNTRGKCQIIFSDATHDKEANIFQVRMNPGDQRTSKSPTDSTCNSTYLNLGRQERGLKRQEMDTTVVVEHNRNETGAYYNSLQKYLSIFSQNGDNSYSGLGLHSAQHKKKRAEMEHCGVPSTSDNHLNFEGHTPREYRIHVFASTTATAGTQNGRQVFEDLLALEPTGRTIKRRSRAPTRVRKLASLMEIHKQVPASSGREATTSRPEQGFVFPNKPYAYFDAQETATHTKMTTKQAKKSMTMDSTLQYSHQLSTSMGQPPAMAWITERLNQLDLNATSEALVAYHTNYQELNALVPYQGSGTLVPFDDQVKRKRTRAKVNLDDETTRVWKLLLENINNEGIDGTDEEKAKWWDEERRIFRGRADSFIARMHLVQGDRRFSPWKGSVVDSVVGVFLTQNVSDHLSSSAFMSVAARFPAGEKTHPPMPHEETLSPIPKEAEVCEIKIGEISGFNRKNSTTLAYGDDTKTLQHSEAASIREANIIKTFGKNSDGLISEDNNRGQSRDSSKHSHISHETVTNKSGSLVEDRKDTEDTLSSQNSTSSVIELTEGSNSCLCSPSLQEPIAGDQPDGFTSSTSCMKLLQMVGSVLQVDCGSGNDKIASDQNQKVRYESLAINLESEDYLENTTVSKKHVASSSMSTPSHVPKLGMVAAHCDLSQKASTTSNSSSKNELSAAETSGLTCESASQSTFQKAALINFQEEAKLYSNHQSEITQPSEAAAESSSQDKMVVNPDGPEDTVDATGSSSNIDSSRSLEHKDINSNKNDTKHHAGKPIDVPKGKGEKVRKGKENVDWEHLRKQANTSREKTRTGNKDSVDWDAVRRADVNVLAQAIKERGMNNILAGRIKDFLNRLVRDHGSIDLEWLRDVPPDKAKEYLLSIRGLGLKSVECVRLLTLHHLAFPVDTNVGRIAVRLGWVPLQPLPESLQLHLLEMYPVLESIQKYLWPRLCKLDQRTLYELHYQMITFGKVFCTKSKPNCNACPMRAECRHFASAFASARLALPAPGETSIMGLHENRRGDQTPMNNMNNLRSPPPHMNQIDSVSQVRNTEPIIEEPASPEPIIEVPTTPEPSNTEASVCDIEDAFSEDPDEIPTIQLNMEEFTHNLQKLIQQNELQEGEMSKALVALTPEAASIPVPKLKNVSRLRTEHQVYELPDSHPLLQGMDKREPDDPCPYLLAIWTPGETVDSIQPPERRCSSQGIEMLCTDASCSSCNSIREASSQTVRGTILIPCRTAMRGSFPLNGTYFQVNELFSDHESSLLPMDVPRRWLWNLPRRTVYFGTSIPTIFKGLSTEGIQYCFWRGFVCVRGFDRKTRAPRPLIARLHFPASRLGKGKGKIDEDNQ